MKKDFIVLRAKQLEEIKKAFDKNNLQWFTVEENRKKGSKIICYY